MLYYLGPWDGKGPIKSANPHKAPSANDRLLGLDLIKEHLQNKGNGPFISLFGSTNPRLKGAKALEINTSKLNGTRLYKVRDNTQGMSGLKGPLPDYLACAEIPFKAIRKL